MLSFPKKDGPMQNRKAFTLVELLIVVAIIAAILAFLLPVLGAMREKGRQTQCISNLAQLGKALHMYADNWNGYIPPYNTLDASKHPGHDALLARAFAPYLREPRVWFCPSDPYAGQGAVPFVDSNFSHRYGSYATSAFVPPVMVEPGHRLITTPWRVDAPGIEHDRDPSSYAYLADWFADSIQTPDLHNGSANFLAFDGRVVSERKSVVPMGKTRS
jgi:prepilin-type N-terminal cleavage/methylation domain-containing protein/prepilin-type processing-associated H-X9-DG protein